MDAAEYEGDIQLQKAASGLLADFESSLKPFLWRTLESGKVRIRRRVRAREKDRLLRLLAPFQELPQLLDPHLEKFLPALAEAYLESLRQAATSKKPLENVALLVPLSGAICELLYTFCKIRGEKVVVRFLNAKTRYLELLLSALEVAESIDRRGTSNLDVSTGPASWSWEERYVCLLWLSHLLLAPFDLATISSAGTAAGKKLEILGLSWPANLPGVALRIIPMAIKYLASAGKERDAAKTLLVRISMRKDMQELGLLHALVQWALVNLQSSTPTATVSTYHYIGVLSFLSGLLVSSTSMLDLSSYLSKIFSAVQAISEDENPTNVSIRSSALARKIIIKVMRAITIIDLQLKTSSTTSNVEGTDVVEATVSHLLEALADNDTPVRLAASKALSIITLSLPPAMAMQVIEAVLESMTHNVLWMTEINGGEQGKTRDLSSVNPLEWHGLVLTLSHLLYRRALPPESLSEILNALLIGLSFERRSTSGSSIGTNVRDAACFGIWALSRRYSTAELRHVTIPLSHKPKQDDPTLSVVQILATELVVSASLDPAGNIRRGASAALQELIGRHPDTVDEGIAVVQVVDYHAVALRSRAMLEVASEAALLSRYYQDSLLSALLSWRGTGDGDAASRRNAASCIGLLARGFQPDGRPFEWKRLITLLTTVERRLNYLDPRESDQRHGLLLSLAAAIASLPEIVSKNTSENVVHSLGARETIAVIYRIVTAILDSVKSITDRRVDMVAEGVSRVILATIVIFPIDFHIHTAVTLNTPNKKITKDNVEPPQLPHLDHSVAEPGIYSGDSALSHSRLENLIALAEAPLMTWLRRTEEDVLNAATEAAVSLMFDMHVDQRSTYVKLWISELLDVGGGRLVPGHLFSLVGVFPIVTVYQRDETCHAILQKWRATTHIGSRIAMLQSLVRGGVLDSHATSLVGMIAEGLDDYTTDGRGDIGSLVRVEAIRAARKAFKYIPWDNIGDENDDSKAWFREVATFSTLYGKVLRLAAEKLDRVRIEAQETLAQGCRSNTERQRFESFTISSFDYFRWLLDLQVHNWLSLPLFEYQPAQWSMELFEGLVTSADTGSEDLIRVSRAALVDFCDGETSQVENSNTQIDLKGFVCETLLSVAKKNLSNDRVLVPTLEVISFLFDAGIMQQSNLEWRSLYLLVQKSHYKTGNMRKLEAAVKVYGGLAQVYPAALEKLSSMLLHPFPKIRSQVADVLFVVSEVGKGVDWMRAGKEDLRRLKGELGV